MSTEATPTPPTFASEFYLWLWWASEAHEGIFHLPAPTGLVNLWVADRLTFRRPDETRVSAVMTGVNPAAALESRAALQSGKRLNEIHIGLRRDDREYQLSLKGTQIDYSGLRLPTVAADTVEEAVTDRMLLLEEVNLIVAALVQQFADLRLGTSWTTVEEEMEMWLGTSEMHDR